MKKKTTILIFLFLLSAAGLRGSESLQDKVRQLEEKLKTVTGTARVDILVELASNTYSSLPEKCAGYCEEIFRLTAHLENSRQRAKAKIYLSYANDVLGRKEKNLDLCKEALEIFKFHNDKKGILQSLDAIGYYYKEQDFFKPALDYFLKSLRISEELNDLNGQYRVNWNLGSLYYKLNDYPESFRYYNQSMKLARRLSNDLLTAATLNSLGINYLDSGEYEKALDAFRQASALFEKQGRPFWIGACLNNTGNVYGRMNRNKEALETLARAHAIHEKINNKSGSYWSNFYAAEILMKMGNYTDALSYLHRALDIAMELKNRNRQQTVFKTFARLHAAMGKYKEAYDYQQQYSDTREELFNQDMNKQLAELRVHFEAEKRTTEIQLLRRENQLQKLTRNASIIGLILVLFILVLLFKKYLYLLAFWKKQKYVGHYRLLEKIGVGGSGTVYRAYAVDDKTQVAAVKVLNEDLTEDQCNRQRFIREGNLIDQLVHPNIVRIYERGMFKDTLFIALEFLQGRTLADKIKHDGPLELHECLTIMIQITSALEFIHGKNILHRDIKPSNIMLLTTESIVVKLLDFGTALTTFQTRLTRSGMLVGTIYYTAPELITQNLSSTAGDIYALGVTFFEMLTGGPVFHGDTITTVVEKILDDAPGNPGSFRPGLPEELDQLVTRMLAKEPGARPPAKDILTALKRCRL